MEGWITRTLDSVHWWTLLNMAVNDRVPLQQALCKFCVFPYNNDHSECGLFKCDILHTCRKMLKFRRNM
jgi:hypothetical protein